MTMKQVVLFLMGIILASPVFSQHENTQPKLKFVGHRGASYLAPENSRASIMEQCRKAGLDVGCWTLNHPEIARKMKEMGVTAITTDRPGWLKEYL